MRWDPPASGRWSAPEADRTPPPVGRSLGGGRCDDRPPPRSVSLLAVSPLNALPPSFLANPTATGFEIAGFRYAN